MDISTLHYPVLMSSLLFRECKWTHRRRGYEFSSEGRQSSRDNEVVSLDRTKVRTKSSLDETHKLPF